MRFVNRYIKIAALIVSAVGLSVLLTACPGVTPPSLGFVDVGVYATNSDRCDDGVKVVVEGIQDDWDFGNTIFGFLPEDDPIRDRGRYWLWVKPGNTAGMQWDVPVASPASKHPEGKQITIKAYCMRKDAEPGLSQKSYALADYIVTRGPSQLLELGLQVRDSGADPSYTVTPPGLTIEPHE